MVSVAIRIIIIYLLAVNLVSFALMGIDKRKAIKHVWRVPETALFCLQYLGEVSEHGLECTPSGTRQNIFGL